MKKIQLDLRNKFIESFPVPIPTLQVFITNACTETCPQCFYRDRLGKGQMTLEEYELLIKRFIPKGVQKIILLGGEPTMHPDLPRMVAFNAFCGLSTTIYSNGFDMGMLAGLNTEEVDIRIGTHSFDGDDKPATKIQKVGFRITLTYMINTHNKYDLKRAAEYAEQELGCKRFFISSMRDITVSGDYWKDTEDTVPLPEYAAIIQDFLDTYEGNMRLHISRRGILEVGESPYLHETNRCRFLNIFPNGETIICPFDIAKNIISDVDEFYSRACNKHTECILQKIVLQKK